MECVACATPNAPEAYYWLGSAVELGLLLLVVRYAWTWPRQVDGVDSRSAVGSIPSGPATP